MSDIAHIDSNCNPAPRALHSKSWIALARDVQDHEVVGLQVQPPEPADKTKAAWFPYMVWTWMLMTASHQRREKVVGGKEVLLKRGQLALSERLLADKANWSRKAVRCFLGRLQRYRMVHLDSPRRKGQMTLDLVGTERGPTQGPPTSIITICNYDKYQSAPEAKGPPRGPGRAQQQQETPKKVVPFDRYPKPNNPSSVVATTLPPFDYKGLAEKLFAAAGDRLHAARGNGGLEAMTIPRMWLDEGADLERDVLPVIAHMAAKAPPGKIRSWAYFTGAVADAKAAREKGLPAPIEIGKPKPNSEQDWIEQKIRLNASYSKLTSADIQRMEAEGLARLAASKVARP